LVQRWEGHLAGKNLASAIRFFRGRPIEDTAQCGVIMGKTCWLKQMPKADTADE